MRENGSLVVCTGTIRAGRNHYGGIALSDGRIYISTFMTVAFMRSACQMRGTF
jgi:hypothetical protein